MRNDFFTSGRLAPISACLDIVYVRGMDGSYGDLHDEMNSAVESLSSTWEADPAAILAIKAGAAERLFVGAVQRNERVQLCVELFRNITFFGFRDSISRWMLTEMFVKYLCQFGGYRDLSSALIAEVKAELHGVERGVEECLQAIERFEC